jgi:hypothetical protein
MPLVVFRRRYDNDVKIEFEKYGMEVWTAINWSCIGFFFAILF